MQLLSIKLYKLQSYWQLLIKVLGENIGLLNLKNRIEILYRIYKWENLQIDRQVITFDVLLNDSRIHKNKFKNTGLPSNQMYRHFKALLELKK